MWVRTTSPLLEFPMLAGREIDDRDLPNGLTVAVINQAFARKFFANRNPIGKHVTDVYGDQRTPFEVVGVARDSRDHSLRDKIPPRVFVSLLQGKFGNEVLPMRRATKYGPEATPASPRICCRTG